MWKKDVKVLTLQVHPTVDAAMEAYRAKTGCPKAHIVRQALMQFLGVTDLTAEPAKETAISI